MKEIYWEVNNKKYFFFYLDKVTIKENYLLFDFEDFWTYYRKNWETFVKNNQK